MKIEKVGDEIIVHIPYYQTGKYTYGEGTYKVPSCIGIISKDEITINYLIYLDYKDENQIGSPIIHWCIDPNEKDIEEFRKLCSQLNLDVWDIG